MGIIACTTGTHAAYIANGTTTYVPVEAWDLDGNPLVAGARGLVDASENRGLGVFAHLEAKADVARVQSWYEDLDPDEDEDEIPDEDDRPMPARWTCRATVIPSRRRRALHIAA